MDIKYTLSLLVTRPVRLNDYEDTLAVTADWMQTAEAKRELEKEVLQALRKLDGDCDVEVMETERIAGEADELFEEGHRELTRSEKEQGLVDSGREDWAEGREDR